MAKWQEMARVNTNKLLLFDLKTNLQTCLYLYMKVDSKRDTELQNKFSELVSDTHELG